MGPNNFPGPGTGIGFDVNRYLLCLSVANSNYARRNDDYDKISPQLPWLN
jgi:hypothetical protein